MQGDVANELFEVFALHGRFFASADFHQHADFGAGVDVSGNEAVAGDFESNEARDLDVFTNLRDSSNAVSIERLDRRTAGEFFGDVIAEGFEAFVTGDEVGFAVDFGQDTDFGAGLDVLCGSLRSLASRPDFLAAVATPFLRSRSTAASRLPLVSVSSFAIQRIKPAPVISRSLPTFAALISLIV